MKLELKQNHQTKMTAMMRKASIVLLFGLVALTNAAGAASSDFPPKKIPEETRFIITPTKMKDDHKKASNLKKYWEIRNDFTDRVKSWVGAMKKQKDAEKVLADWDKKINRDLATEVKNAEASVDDLATQITALKEGTEALEQDVKDKKDDAEIALKDHKATLKKKKSAKAAWDKVVAELKKEEAEQKQGNAIPEGKAKEDSPWGKKRKTANDKVEAAKKDVSKYSEADVWKVPASGGKQGSKDQVPETGGADYYMKKLNDIHPQMMYWTTGVDVQDDSLQQLSLPDTTTALTAPFANAFDGLTFEGFVNDHDTMKFIVKGHKTLEDVEKVFKYKLPAYKGEPQKEEKIATVEEAKNTDKACLTLDIGVKISEDTYNYDPQKTYGYEYSQENMKDHGAHINGFVIGVETITMKDRKLQKETIADDGKITYDDVPKKDDEEQQWDEYSMYFINLEGMGLSVYRSGKAHKNMFYQRDGKYEAVGDMTAMSASLPAPAGTTPGSTSTTKPEEPSKAWMVVAIIALVILFLGGAVIAYRAYTASGSLQNTDI